MLERFLLSLLCFGLLTIGISAQQSVPTGWLQRGSAAGDYITGVDHSIYHGGKASGYIEYVLDPMIVQRGFATLMQAVKADKYHGKRIRLSGYLKTERVKKSAALWVRVEGKHINRTFDVGTNSGLGGTSDWKRVEAVFDVPSSAQGMAFGVLLDGKGRVWIDDLRLDIVDKRVSTTTIRWPFRSDDGIDLQKYSNSATNLDFEQ
ncbi:MAG: hypothetical protein HY961_17795 [Ignavibacteriae bacterium]|nr:hypothetical protein [Ignavibacteriota bacterium]